MSARVFTPVALNEIPRLSRALVIEGNLVQYSNKDAAKKVRRALFNPNADETRRFLQDEFAKMASTECNRWNFDFVSGCPLSTHGVFEWTAVSESRSPHLQTPVKRLVAPDQNCLDAEALYAPIASSAADVDLLQVERPTDATPGGGGSNSDDDVALQVEKMTVDSSPSSPQDGKDAASASAARAIKRQRHITDFMKVRKRIEERPVKKLDTSSGPLRAAPSSRPRKMPRLSSLS